MTDRHGCLQVVVAFRGTASLANVRSDLEVYWPESGTLSAFLCRVGLVAGGKRRRVRQAGWPARPSPAPTACGCRINCFWSWITVWLKSVASSLCEGAMCTGSTSLQQLCRCALFFMPQNSDATGMANSLPGWCGEPASGDTPHGARRLPPRLVCK